MTCLHHLYLILGEELLDNLSNLRFFGWFSIQSPTWSEYILEDNPDIELSVGPQLRNRACDGSFDVFCCHCLNLAGVFFKDGDLSIFLLLEI